MVNKLVEKSSRNIDENKLIYNETLNNYKKVCNSYAIYIVFLVIFFIIKISITITNYNANNKTVIY